MISLQQKVQRQQDLHLVRKIKRGDQQAFRSLVERYQRQIYRLAFAVVRSHASADDITQDTFVKVYRHLVFFDETYPFYPWLRRIAINTALSARQSTLMRKAEPLDEHLPQEPAIDRLVERAELLQQVLAEIERLPEEQRLVFVLRTQQEMSYAEIAEALNISPGTVMSRLNRARSRLKARLRDHI
jgi:RNA polymerase sigma-70 factor, ECF subfamily